MTTTDDHNITDLRPGTKLMAQGLMDQAERGIRALIMLTGSDPDSEGLVRTPARVVSAVLDMTRPPGDPAEFLAVTFPAADVDEMVHLGPIPFTALCEHHLLPFSGYAHIAYIPQGGRVVGVSKLARLVEHFACQLQIQERMTTQIADALVEHLDPGGVGVVLRATHSCMELRGVRKAGASLSTSALRGAMRDQADTRAEFMVLVHSAT
jgi:GTP cyclohydrolase IA